MNNCRIFQTSNKVYYIIPFDGIPNNLSNSKLWEPLDSTDDPIFSKADEFSQHISDLYKKKQIRCYRSVNGAKGWEPPMFDTEDLSFCEIFPEWQGSYLYCFSSGLSCLIVETQFVYHYTDKNGKSRSGRHFNLYTTNEYESLLKKFTEKIRQAKKATSKKVSPVYTYLIQLFPNENGLFSNRPEIYTFLDSAVQSSINAEKEQYREEIKKFEQDLSQDATLDNRLVGDVTISSNGKCCENIVLDGGSIFYQYVKNERYLLFKERECLLLDLNHFGTSVNGVHSLVTNSFLFTYLFALHERHALTHFISKSVCSSDSVALHSELLNLQRNYIYDVISNETRYQSFYTALLEYFGNEKLEKELGEINDRLAEEQIRKKDNLVNLFLTYISILSIISVLTDIHELSGSRSATLISAILILLLIPAGLFVIFHYRNNR